MTSKQHDEDDSSYNDSVPTKGLEAIFLYVSDKELDGQHRNDKSHYITHNECSHVIHNQFCTSFFNELVHLV